MTPILFFCVVVAYYIYLLERMKRSKNWKWHESLLVILSMILMLVTAVWVLTIEV